MKRAALGLVAALLVLVAWIAPPALAHVELLTSTPEDGAVLSALPAEVSLIFNEDLLPEAVNLSVNDSVGTVVRIAGPTVDGQEVTFPWPGWPASDSGDQWTVNYRVVSQDGHPVTGSITFTAPPPTVPTPPATAATAVPASPAPVSTDAAAPTESSSSPWGPVIAIVIGLAIGIGIGTYYVRRARRTS